MANTPTQAIAASRVRRRADAISTTSNSRISTSSTSSASIRTTRPPMRPGRRRRSRPSTMRRCAISSSTCTGCSIRTTPARAEPDAERGRSRDAVGASGSRSSRCVPAGGRRGGGANICGSSGRPAAFVIEPADIYERVEPRSAGHLRDVARTAFPDAVRQAVPHIAPRC